MTEVPSEAPSNVIFIEDPAVGVARELEVGVRLERRTLHVSWSKREGELSYTIYSSDSTEEGEWVQPGPDTLEQIENFWKKLDIILSDAITRGSPSKETWESIYLSLRSIGENLFSRLIPFSVAERVQKWQTGFSIRVSTNEQWIPWELMHDGQDFLGNKFIVARYPRLSDRKILSGTNRPESKGFKQITRIVNIVGGGVPATEAQQASQLFSKLLPLSSVDLLQEKPISVLAATVAGADALHCTCHGFSEPQHLLQIAADRSPTQNLSLDTIKNLQLLPGSLVFANACASNVPVQSFGQFNSFGWEFYRQGAGVFIGTLGIVPAKYAVNFAESFYHLLFREDAKLTVGQALAKAKEVAAKEHNLFWLLYCVYGDPDFYYKTH